MLRVTGINEAIRTIKQYKRTLKDRMKELVERLMNEGYLIAGAAFRGAEYAGTNDVIVDEPKWEGNTLYLMAHGEAVAFIEFGTGKGTFDEYPIPTPAGIVPHGEYGKKKGANPPWTYVGDAGNSGTVIHTKKDGREVIRTYGNPPARALYRATKFFDQDRVTSVAKEVFKP